MGLHTIPGIAQNPTCAQFVAGTVVQNMFLHIDTLNPVMTTCMCCNILRLKFAACFCAKMLLKETYLQQLQDCLVWRGGVWDWELGQNSPQGIQSNLGVEKGEEEGGLWQKEQ